MGALGVKNHVVKPRAIFELQHSECKSKIDKWKEKKIKTSHIRSQVNGLFTTELSLKAAVSDAEITLGI